MKTISKTHRYRKEDLYNIKIIKDKMGMNEIDAIRYALNITAKNIQNLNILINPLKKIKL